MIVYASLGDLTSGTSPWFAPAAPANAPALLRWASILVARAANRDLYTDAPAVGDAPALRDATCAQVASWAAQGVDPAKGGTDVNGPVKSSTILSAKVDRDTTAAVQAAADARDGLCALAVDILQSAGLLWVPVPMGDDTGYLSRWGLDTPVGYGATGYEWPALAEWPWYY